MADETFPLRIQLKRKTTAEWASLNPVLLKGEPGIEVLTDGSEKIKYGDGVKTWSLLGYAAGGGSGSGPALSSAAPQALGATASAGTSLDASRADHVHPRPTAGQVGADASGTAAAAVAAHEGAVDPHPGYLTAAEGNAAYATAAQGAKADSAIQPGNPALSDARMPTAHKSSHAVGGSDALSPADIGAAATGHGHAISNVSGLQTALDEKASSGDSRLSDSREWSADTISQDEAEGGSATTRRAFTAQRVFQAIASWWNGSAAKTKLDGIQDGAQVNVATNLSYDASTRLLSSSTGDDTTLPLVTTSAAGLVPASGGGTTNFLRADGMFAAPPGGTPGGSSGQVQFNDGGVFGGLSTLTADGSGNITLTARLINAFNAAASAPAKLFSGTWFTGGTSTTTKPHVLIEPAGTASTSWNTAGTGFAVNGPSGFTGDLAWFGVAGARGLGIDSTGRVSVPLGTAALPSIYPGTDANTGIYSPGADQIGISTNGTARLLINSSGYVGVGVNPIDQGFSLAVPTPGFSGDSAFGGGVATATNSYRNFEWGLRVSGEASSALNGRCSVQYVLYPGAGGSDSEIRFVTNKYGASRGPRLTIDSTGNIGFGTTTPASLLHLADAGHVTVGTTTGTKFGTATNQKLGFFNATPIVQPASADQAALTNSTGGTANGTLSAVGNTSTADQAAVINDNFTELFRLQNEMRTALVSLGLIKGAA